MRLNNIHTLITHTKLLGCPTLEEIKCLTFLIYYICFIFIEINYAKHKIYSLKKEYHVPRLSVIYLQSFEFSESTMQSAWNQNNSDMNI